MPSTTTETTFRIHDVLRAVSSALEVPVVIVLILFLLAAAVLTGWVIAEFFTERRHLKVALPQLLEDLRTADDRAAVKFSNNRTAASRQMKRGCCFILLFATRPISCYNKN